MRKMCDATLTLGSSPTMAYRQSGQAQDLAIDPDDLLAAQRRGSRKRLAIAAIAIIFVSTAAVATAFVVQSRSKESTRVAYSRFATCLVGGLSAAEGPSVRVRNTQLAAMAIPQDKREVTSGGEWPARCAPLSHAFGAAVSESGGPAELSSAAEKLGKALAAESAFSIDLSALVDEVFSRAKAMGVVVGPAPSVPLPPAPAAPLSLATLPRDGHLLARETTLASVHKAPFSEPALRFVIDDKDVPAAPAVCLLAPGQSEIVCRRVPAPAASLSPALRLWGTTEEHAHPFVFAGVRGKMGIFDAESGARISDRLEYGAYGASSLNDGTFAFLVWNEKPTPSTHLVTLGADGSKREELVVSRKESGNPYYSSALFGRHVAYKQVRKGADGIRLVVRALEARGLGPAVDIGRIDEVGHIEGGTDEEPHLTACRNGDALVIRAKGWENTFLSFKTRDAAWSPPIESHGLSGALTCNSAGTATVTRTWGNRVGSRYRGGVEQSFCTSSECKERSLDVPWMLKNNDDLIPREAKDIRAVDVDGKLLVVWRAGDRGGLRLRLAPIDRIGAESDVVVFDDHDRAGVPQAESTLVDFDLLPAPQGAILLLGTVDGVFPFLVHEHGMPRILKARF